MNLKITYEHLSKLEIIVYKKFNAEPSKMRRWKQALTEQTAHNARTLTALPLH